MHYVSPRTLTTIGSCTLVTAALGLSGCGAVTGGSASSSSSSSAMRTVHTITYVNPAPFYPAFTDVGNCFAAEAKKNGWNPVQVGTSGSAVDNQGAVNLISQAIANGTDALVVFPTIPQLFAPVLKQARAKGIYVVAQNAGDPSDGQQTQVGTDAHQLGEIIAAGLGAKYPDAKVGVLSGSASTTPHVQEIQGFKDYAKAHFPNIRVVDSQYDNGDATKAPELFSNMLASHPNITVLFPIEGTDVAAAITAVKERNLKAKVSVVANDLTADHRAAIENGSLFGVGEQGWCEAGTKSVAAVKDLSEGKAVPATIPTTSVFYSKDNLPAK